MFTIISIVSLLISLGALSIAVLTYRNSKRKEALENHARALDDALECETILRVLQSNLLTVDLTNLRKSVADSIASALDALPQMLQQAETTRQRIQALPPTADVTQDKRTLRVLRAEAKTWADMFAHGLERGHNV